MIDFGGTWEDGQEGKQWRQAHMTSADMGHRTFNRTWDIWTLGHGTLGHWDIIGTLHWDMGHWTMEDILRHWDMGHWKF